MNEKSDKTTTFSLGHTTEECTMQLRWVPKSMMQAMDLKLQQAWKITVHDSDGKPWKGGIEWRDVPTDFGAVA